jgi:glutamyl-Q tRNA(Asp) synthetase
MLVNPYIGRFAPTPSGHLHFGSLLAALASFLDARHHDGLWLMRMEDLDQPREVPGAADAILRTLELYGLHWDGPVMRQSARHQVYQSVIDGWLSRGLAYRCSCSRRELQDSDIYPGYCRGRHLPASTAHAVRARAPELTLGFQDRLQGHFAQHLPSQVGDFIIRRRDGIVAYQLAVVVDDIEQGVNQVVRGADLMDSTPRQLWLYRIFDQPPPDYLHIPLVMRADGQKLSKRLASPALDPRQAPTTLHRALLALGQRPPDELRSAPVSDQLDWAIAHWRPDGMPAVLERLEGSLSEP